MKIKTCFLAIFLSLVAHGALGRGDPNAPGGRPGPTGQIEGVTAPDTVTLGRFQLSWEWQNQADYFSVYGKAPGSSTYVKVGETEDEAITLTNTVNGKWKYIVEGCGYSTYCGEFSDPKEVTFQRCHDPVKKDGVQAFSIVTNTTQCINLDVTANEESYLVYSNLTYRNKAFFVRKGHNAKETNQTYGGGFSFARQPNPLGTKFTPGRSKVSLGMNINYHGQWDHERTQVMVVYDEDTRVLSLMYMNFEGEASL